MVEVFKTNVKESFHAEILINLICKSFKGYSVSFDLEDCDKILRIESLSTIEAQRVMALARDLGFQIEILPDEISYEQVNSVTLLYRA